ncbi:MAG: hypothetical protein LBH98_08380 [Chitinispirillales bacterium]|jgi:hypothetical protein|nr:hypothetical protein [Chitinispirillales bacterium]
MSKVIIIFVAFSVIIVIGTGILATIYFPNSLESMKAEIVEASAKNGFETKIERADFRFPNLIEFGGVCVGDFSKNIKADAKSFELEISLLAYARAIYKQKIKKEKVGISDFSNSAKLKNIVFGVNDKEIFSDAKANLRFEKETLKYDLLINKVDNFYFHVKKIEASGTIDSGFFSINSNIKIFEGNLNMKANFDSYNYLLKDIEAVFNNIEIKNLFPDLCVYGKISGTMVSSDFVDIKSDFSKILREKQAVFSIEMSDFKYNNQKYSKPILSAVSVLGINNLDFAKITTNFDYSYSKVRVNSFLADNFKYAVSANGHYSPQNNKLDFSIQIHFNPDMKFAVRKEIWNAMVFAEPKNEGRKIGGRIDGHVSGYSISLDNEVMKKGVNSFLKEIEKLF